MYSRYNFPDIIEFQKIPAIANKKGNHLAHVCNNVKIEGLVLEFGVHKGQSLKLIAELLSTKTVYGFDSFEGLPEDWFSPHGEFLAKGTFQLDEVPNFDNSNIQLIKGWFSETIPKFKKEIIKEPISILHIDSDLYSSAKTILYELNDNIVSGTLIIFDEIHNFKTSENNFRYEENEFRALKEWVSEFDRNFTFFSRSHDCQAAILIIK